MYTVYKYTSPSNKVYIGLTSGTQNKRARSKGYGYKRCTAFWRAIEKYGWDNFTYEILAQDLTEEDAKQLEKYYIKLYDSTNPEKGYNITAGGDGFCIYDYEVIQQLWDEGKGVLEIIDELQCDKWVIQNALNQYGISKSERIQRGRDTTEYDKLLQDVLKLWNEGKSVGEIQKILNINENTTTHALDKLQIDSVKTVLSNGFIPIFPCIGWSSAGKPYNISSIQLAHQIAVHLQADKLFFLIPGLEINSSEGTIPAMNLEEVDEFLAKNATENSVVTANSTECSVENAENSNVSRETHTICSLLELAKSACEAGVSRVHLLNGSLNGTLPCEIFSNLGSGTMIYKSNYGGIREMTREDIPAVLNLMHPFVQKGNLLPRTAQQMQTDFQHYIVYVMDDAVRACAALIPYDGGQMEIAGVAVDESCSHIGIGQTGLKTWDLFLQKFLLYHRKEKICGHRKEIQKFSTSCSLYK